MKRLLILFTIASCLSFIGGCGGSSHLGPVMGTVSLDGKPLANAIVSFQPSSGRRSEAITDSSGQYQLSYTADEQGALIGSHTVIISTAKQDWSEEQKVFITMPEQVPAKFNAKSELTAEVQPGSNTLNFELTSQ